MVDDLPPRPIDPEAAHVAGQRHGARAYFPMLSAEMFEEFLRSELSVWREAGFSGECLEAAEPAARAAYRGNASGGS